MVVSCSLNHTAASHNTATSCGLHRVVYRHLRTRLRLVYHAPIRSSRLGRPVSGVSMWVWCESKYLCNLDLGAAMKMPTGDSADPIYLSSDSEEDGGITRGMLSAAAKGKGRATNMALDADQGVERTITENQTAYTGGADVSVNGTRPSTPGKPSSVAVADVLPQSQQSLSNRDELHQFTSTSLRNQQGIGRSSQLSTTPHVGLENPSNPLGKHA